MAGLFAALAMLAPSAAQAETKPAAVPAKSPSVRCKPLPEKASNQLGALDYRILGKEAVAPSKSAGADPDLDGQLELLNLEKTNKGYKEMKDPPKKPPLEKKIWVPSWTGTTGGLDLPWAYVLKKGSLVASVVAKDRDTGSIYWPLVYKKISGADRGLTVSYGLFEGFEVSADLDREDRTFQYAQQKDAYTGLTVPSAQFHGDRTLSGFGLKGAATTDDLQFAVGLHATSFRNLDRNVIEFHDYDRMNSIYAVASTKEGRRFKGHFSAAYVTYDWGGSIYPSGATTAPNPANPSATTYRELVVDGVYGARRPGFAPGRASPGISGRGEIVYMLPDGTLSQDPASAATGKAVGKVSSDWFNLGFGLDVEISRNLLLLGELTWETGIDFIDVGGRQLDSWFVNAGARYTRRNWAATFGVRHVNTRDYREPILSLAYRF